MKSIAVLSNKWEEVFGGEFEVIRTGFSTGQENMDFDMDRTRAVAEGTEMPMFRLYGWEPWAVSLGANQKEEDINKDSCEKLGFDIVRRPTGGRAVLHANELTYSVVLNLPNEMTVHDLYREIHSVLLKSFHRLGIALEFEKAQPNFKEFYKESAMSVSCFASSARYEISNESRKIVGSAQRLFGKTLLQHGSILIGSGHEKLAEVTNIADDKKPILLDYINSHSSTLSEVANREITFEECEQAIFQTLLL